MLRDGRELCQCGEVATRKVGEEPLIGHGGDRHNLTAFMCEGCFRRLFGDAAVTRADEFDAAGPPAAV